MRPRQFNFTGRDGGGVIRIHLVVRALGGPLRGNSASAAGVNPKRG